MLGDGADGEEPRQFLHVVVSFRVENISIVAYLDQAPTPWRHGVFADGV